MHLDRFVGRQPHLHLEHVAGVDHADLVGGIAVEPVVAHLERLVVQRPGVPAPGAAPGGVLVEAGLRTVQGRGVLVIGQARDQMGPAAGIAEVVVETAGPRIGPVHDRVDLLEP